MSILILGGTGYLGSKIVHELTKRNFKVGCLYKKESDLTRLQDVKNIISFIPCSIDAVERYLSCNEVDWMINCACSYGKVNGNEEVIESNLKYPLDILNCCVRNQVENFITIGTGLPDNFNMYSFSKKIFAEFGQFYVRKNFVNFSNIELEMFYGVDEPKERFISNCIDKLVRNEDLLLTEGTQKRDIVAVEDVIEAIMYIYYTKPKGFNNIGVGTGEAPTIKEIVKYMHQCIGSKSVLKFGAVPMRENEPDSATDISLLNEWGFHCQYSWKEGLNKMIRETKGI